MAQSSSALPPLRKPRATKPLRFILETAAREFRCFARRAGDIDEQMANGLDVLIGRYDAATKAPAKPRRALR